MQVAVARTTGSRRTVDANGEPDCDVAVAPGLRGECAMELCEAMLDIVAALFNVSGKELRRPGRTQLGVTRVRQVAMYVTHVALGVSMREVGRGFGRDRTTVLYACHLIEDMRDDEDFDRIVTMTERVATAAFRSRLETRA